MLSSVRNCVTTVIGRVESMAKEEPGPKKVVCPKRYGFQSPPSFFLYFFERELKRIEEREEREMREIEKRHKKKKLIKKKIFGQSLSLPQIKEKEYR